MGMSDGDPSGESSEGTVLGASESVPQTARYTDRRRETRGMEALVERSRLDGDEHVTMQAMTFTLLGCAWSAHEPLGAPRGEAAVGKTPDGRKDR